MGEMDSVIQTMDDLLEEYFVGKYFKDSNGEIYRIDSLTIMDPDTYPQQFRVKYNGKREYDFFEIEEMRGHIYMGETLD